MPPTPDSHHLGLWKLFECDFWSGTLAGRVESSMKSTSLDSGGAESSMTSISLGSGSVEPTTTSTSLGSGGIESSTTSTSLVFAGIDPRRCRRAWAPEGRIFDDIDACGLSSVAPARGVRYTVWEGMAGYGQVCSPLTRRGKAQFWISKGFCWFLIGFRGHECICTHERAHPRTRASASAHTHECWSQAIPPTLACPRLHL